jgi:hypothetical protein
MARSLARHFARAPLSLIVPITVLLWATTTAVLAADRGEERRAAFNGAVQK